MSGPSALPAIAGLTDASVLAPRPDHHRWSVRRDGELLVLHVARRRFGSGRDRRRAEARLAALRELGDRPGLDPVVDGGIESGELWWLTPAPHHELDGGPMALDEAVRIGVDLAAGLARLHAGGLVAATVGPDAVVPTADGARLAVGPIPPEPPVIEAGPAPRHVPPEVLEGRPWTAEADQWGLASTLFTLLEGRSPHQREADLGVPELLLAITLGTRARFHRADVGDALRRVIDRGLDPDPERRPTASAFGAALVAATGAPLGDRLDTVAPASPAAGLLGGSVGLGFEPSAPVAGPEPLGRPLGSAYVLVEPIGRGGMGRVWRGVRRSDGSAVAVKVLRPELADDPEQVARFLTERSALRAVVDPRVVQVHDLVVEGSVLAIVMDLVVGDDLRAVLRREGRLAPAAALELLVGIAGGLEAVHAAGIVHRDVKPENVLVPVDPAGGSPVRLTDFGIARIVDGEHLTRATQLVGTPDYVAPELAAGRQPTAAADVYAFGIVAYELLTGRRPFVGTNPAAVLRAHLESAPMAPPGLDPAVWALIQRCLAKEPERRPSAADAGRELGFLAPTVAGHPRLAPLPDAPALPAAVGPWASVAEADAVPVPVVVGVADAGDAPPVERLETRAGVPLAEPVVAAPAERSRWPWLTLVALAVLVLVGVGWFTARRDTSTSAAPPAATTTTAPQGAQKAFPLAIAVERRQGGGLIAKVPPTLSQPFFAKSDGLRVLYGKGTNPEDMTSAVLSGRVGSGSARNRSAGGLVLGTAVDGGDIIDTLTLVSAKPDDCVYVFVFYRGPKPSPADYGYVGNEPKTCSEAPK